MAKKFKYAFVNAAGLIAVGNTGDWVSAVAKDSEIDEEIAEKGYCLTHRKVRGLRKEIERMVVVSHETAVPERANRYLNFDDNNPLTEMVDLIRTLHELAMKWGMPPIVLSSCAGGTDEHLQIYHPEHLEMPCYVVFPTGVMEEHPDAPFAKIIPPSA